MSSEDKQSAMLHRQRSHSAPASQFPEQPETKQNPIIPKLLALAAKTTEEQLSNDDETLLNKLLITQLSISDDFLDELLGNQKNKAKILYLLYRLEAEFRHATEHSKLRTLFDDNFNQHHYAVIYAMFLLTTEMNDEEFEQYQTDTLSRENRYQEQGYAYPSVKKQNTHKPRLSGLKMQYAMAFFYFGPNDNKACQFLLQNCKAYQLRVALADQVAGRESKQKETFSELFRLKNREEYKTIALAASTVTTDNDMSDRESNPIGSRPPISFDNGKQEYNYDTDMSSDADKTFYLPLVAMLQKKLFSAISKYKEMQSQQCCFSFNGLFHGSAGLNRADKLEVSLKNCINKGDYRGLASNESEKFEKRVLSKLIQILLDHFKGKGYCITLFRSTGLRDESLDTMILQKLYEDPILREYLGVRNKTVSFYGLQGSKDTRQRAKKAIMSEFEKLMQRLETSPYSPPCFRN